MSPAPNFDPSGETSDLSELISADHFAGFHDSDTAAEVDAAFRNQRRIAIVYFAIFSIVLFTTVGATTIGTWANGTRVGSAFTPAFILASVGLFGFFVIVGLAAALLADAVDERMLGASSLPGPTTPPEIEP